MKNPPKELLNKECELRKRIETTEKEIIKYVGSEEFESKYTELNSLRISLESIRNRIMNYGKKDNSLDEYHLPNGFLK